MNKPEGIKCFQRKVEVAHHGFYNIYRDKDWNTYAYIDKQWTEVHWCPPHGCYYTGGNKK